MTIIGLTGDGKKIAHLIASGPTSYPTGGFTITVAELEKIDGLVLSIRSNLKVSNLVHAVDYSYSRNTITVTLYRIDVTAAAPSAWAELPSGTDVSSLVLEIVAIGT